MQLLDGKKTAQDIMNEIAAEVAQMKANGEKVPHLAAVIVGNDGASLTYVGSKVKACERVGFESTLVKMPSTTSETELLKKIDQLNKDENIDGFIVQLPLPEQIDTQKVIMAIDPQKDVDGLRKYVFVHEKFRTDRLTRVFVQNMKKHAHCFGGGSTFV